MSQPKATTNTFTQSHIRMRNKSFQFFPVILSIIIIFTAVSCGGGSTPPSTVPIANPGGPYSANVNQPLAFNGSGSSAPSGRSIISFAWLFGDGASGTGVSPTHAYSIAGNYTATLTVTDSSGATGSSNVAVQINAAPVAKAGGPYTGKVGVPVTFDGSASTFPPGQVPAFSWNFGDGATVGPIAQEQTTHTYTSPCTCTVTLTVTVGAGGSSFATTTATITAGPAPGGESAPSIFFAIGPPANASSQFAYTLTSSSNGASSLSIQTITTTGNLQSTDLTPPSLDANFVPAGMITDPSRKFLYLYGGNSLLAFSIAADTGALIPSGVTSTNGSVNTPGNETLIFTPNGKSAFFITQDSNVADATASGSITRFSVDPNTGALGTIETISAQVSRPQSSAMDPSGKFLYVSGLASAASGVAAPAEPEIAILAITPDTGALTPVSNSPVGIQSGIAATSIAIDSTGHFIFAAGRNSTTNSAALSVFTINSDTGAFTQSSLPLALGDAVADATSLALSPSANFGYVLTTSKRFTATVRQSVQLFQWDVQTGAPTMGNNSIQFDDVADQSAFSVANLILFSPTPLGGASSPNPSRGVFLFVLNLSDSSSIEEKLNPHTGSFVEIAGQSNSTVH